MERPKQNRLYDRGYTWRGTLIVAGVLFGIGVLIVVVMLVLGFHREWWAALFFGAMGVTWGVRAWVLYRHTKRVEHQEGTTPRTDGSPQG